MMILKRWKIAAWIAPVFLLALVALFVFSPWALMDKLQGVCFGI